MIINKKYFFQYANAIFIVNAIFFIFNKENIFFSHELSYIKK